MTMMTVCFKITIIAIIAIVPKRCDPSVYYINLSQIISAPAVSRSQSCEPYFRARSCTVVMVMTGQTHICHTYGVRSGKLFSLKLRHSHYVGPNCCANGENKKRRTSTIFFKIVLQRGANETL